MRIWVKIAILLSAVVFTLAFAIALAMRWVVIDLVQRQNLETRKIVAGTLADSIANLVLTHDHYRAGEALKDAMRQSRDVEYIFVTNLDGQIFAHTFANGHPPDILQWNPLRNVAHAVQLLETERGVIHDIGVNVFEGSDASLHIGVRDTTLWQGLASIRNTVFFLTGLVIVVGIGGAFFFSRVITIPLGSLVQFSQRLSKGEFGESVPVSSGDEMGQLIAAFNALSQELARYKIQMESSCQQMCVTEKLTAMSRLSAGLAHELRNPLTALKVLFDAMGSKEELTDEDMEMVRAEIAQMDGILKRFLGGSRSDALDRQEMDINRSVENVLALIRVPLKNQRISLRFEPGSVPRFVANAPLLEQALLNLYINALEAMPDGGELVVRTACRDNEIQVVVRDTGPGIPDDLLPRVYEPFITSKPEGTGLGLFLVKTIIANHNGTISCQSSKEGTSFTISLPCCRGETSRV